MGKSDPRITINLTHNWWGTTNTSVIDTRIWDQKDDRSLCLINYAPFLEQTAVAPSNLTYPICILSLAQEPEIEVEPYREVAVRANVTDQVVGVGGVLLQYSINGGSTWQNLDMIYNETSELYEAIIPGQPENTIVKYLIIAWDKFNDHHAYWPDQGDFLQPNYCTYIIIPEFSSPIILPLMLILFLVVVVFTKKQNRNRFRVT